MASRDMRRLIGGPERGVVRAGSVLTGILSGILSGMAARAASRTVPAIACLMGALFLGLPAEAQTAPAGATVLPPPPGVTGGLTAGVSGAGTATRAEPVAATAGLGPVNPADLVQGDEPYRLRPGDTIQVSVLEDGSLDRQLLVQPDGRIALPLAGAIDADGLTPDEVEAVIRRRLAADFIEPPTVTVALIGLAPGVIEDETADFETIYVTGQVNSPGRFQIEGPVTALQALAIAGGPGVFAATDRIQVRRVNEDGAETVILFDYDAVEEGRPMGALLELDDGDVLVVPERGLFD